MLAAYRMSVGLTQYELADRLGVRRYTVQRWEQGKSLPSARHRPALAQALSMSPATLSRLLSDDGGCDSLIELESQASMFTTRITRLIPICLSDSKGIRTTLSNNLQRLQISGRLELRTDMSDYAVAILRERATYPTVLDCLRARRYIHLKILQCRRQILKGLNIPNKSPGIEYVMSIQHIEEGDVRTLATLTNPCLVGITDDPSIEVPSSDEVDKHWTAISDITTDVEMVPVRSQAKVYCSWANVVLVGRDSALWEHLEDLEVQLQRIWYRLYFQLDLEQAKAELVDFQRISSTGTSSSHALREALVRTSKVARL